MTTSIDPSGSGIASIRPSRNSTLVAPASAALRRARSSISACHVEPVGEAGRTDSLGRQQHVDPAARTEIEHGLALVEVGDGDRIPAPDARQARPPPEGRRGRRSSPVPKPDWSGPQHAAAPRARGARRVGVVVADLVVDAFALGAHRRLLPVWMCRRQRCPTAPRSGRAPSPARRRSGSSRGSSR